PCQKLSRLPFQHGVGEALERLAEHDVLAGDRLAGTEMQVGELAGAPAMAPLRRQHHQIEGVRTLDLEPARAPIAGLVGGSERLRSEERRVGKEGRYLW